MMIQIKIRIVMWTMKVRRIIWVMAIVIKMIITITIIITKKIGIIAIVKMKNKFKNQNKGYKSE